MIDFKYKDYCNRPKELRNSPRSRLRYICICTVMSQRRVKYSTDEKRNEVISDMAAIKEQELFESEYRFMTLIWETEPIKSTELARLAFERLEWKKSTCYTVLKKLEEKGFVENKQAVVQSLVRKEQVQKAKSRQLIEKSFDGSLPAFLNAFLSDRKLTKKEAEELHRLIENASPASFGEPEQIPPGILSHKNKKRTKGNRP